MATTAQIIALKRLMKREITIEDVHTSTMAAIVKRGWYDIEADIITQEGMKAADIPTFEQPVMVLTRPYSYQGQIIPQGTHIMILMAQRVGRYTVIDGQYNLKGEAIGVRIYKPASARFTHATMPKLESA